MEKLVLNCELCLKDSHSKCKQEPSISLGQEVTLYPWTKLATDIFHFEGTSYLLLVDYTSRFPSCVQADINDWSSYSNWMQAKFSEYGWPETLISDNGPCYTAEVFTNLMRGYSVNTSQTHLTTHNQIGLLKSMSRLSGTCFIKAKEEDMVYCNTSLSNSLWSPMQILSSRSARSDSHVKCSQKLGLDCEDLRNKYKIWTLVITWPSCRPSSHVPGFNKQMVYPATITRLCKRARSYIITTKESVQYRKAQAHLKPYQPQNKKSEDEYLSQSNHMWTVENESKKP